MIILSAGSIKEKRLIPSQETFIKEAPLKATNISRYDSLFF